MSSPAEPNSQPEPGAQPLTAGAAPADASPEPGQAAPLPGFDPIIFWYTYKKQVFVLAGLFAVALVIWAATSIAQEKARTAAQDSLATAKSAEDFRKVIADHAGSPSAASAQLRLAELLRKDGKLDDSTAALQQFIQQNPAHSMIAAAHLSLATNQEAQAKLDEAAASYVKITTTWPKGFAAPVALLGQARVLKAQGKTDDARRIYDQVIAQFANTSYGFEARRESTKLTPKAPPAPKVEAPKVEAPKADAPPAPPVSPEPPKPEPAKPEPAKPEAQKPADAPVPAPAPADAPKQ